VHNVTGYIEIMNKSGVTMLAIQRRSARTVNLAGMVAFQVLEFLISTIILKHSHAVTTF